MTTSTWKLDSWLIENETIIRNRADDQITRASVSYSIIAFAIMNQNRSNFHSCAQLKKRDQVCI